MNCINIKIESPNYPLELNYLLDYLLKTHKK